MSKNNDIQEDVVDAIAKGIKFLSAVNSNTPEQKKLEDVNENVDQNLKTDVTTQVAKNKRCEMVVAKSNDERREITGIVMVADELDYEQHVFTPECVEQVCVEILKKGFNYENGTAVGLQHESEADVTVLGAYYTTDGGMIDGIDAPAHSFVAKIRCNTDELWDKVKEMDKPGFSIETPVRGYIVED